MEQPPDFPIQGECQKVCRLNKAIYGLKQSPRAWFERFSRVVQDYGFTRSSSDHSVFTLHKQIGSVILVVYVDDILLTGSDR